MPPSSTPKRGRSRSHQDAGRVRALDRGLATLEALSKAPELSLTEIAHQVGLAASTAHRILETLRQRDFVQQSPESGLYSIGIKAFEVGASFLAKGQLPEAAAEAMARLVRDVNETVNLAVLDGREAVYIHQVEGQQKVRMFTQIGARTPVHCSGVGKVLLAWQEERMARELLGDTLSAFTSHTLTESEEVLKELERVRERGYALDLEEYEPGVRCLAAPVRDRHGKVVAALSMSAPASRLEGKRMAEVSARLLKTAEEVSARLGWL